MVIDKDRWSLAQVWLFLIWNILRNIILKSIIIDNISSKTNSNIINNTIIDNNRNIKISLNIFKTARGKTVAE